MFEKKKFVYRIWTKDGEMDETAKSLREAKATAKAWARIGFDVVVDKWSVNEDDDGDYSDTVFTINSTI